MLMNVERKDKTTTSQLLTSSTHVKRQVNDHPVSIVESSIRC